MSFMKRCKSKVRQMIGFDPYDPQLGPRGPLAQPGTYIPGEVSQIGPFTPVPYKAAWEKKVLPDEGTGSYAWETLGLYPQSIIDAAVAVRRPDPVPVTQSPQIYANDMVPIFGIPLSAGQIYTQPLVQSDYTPAPDIGFMADSFTINAG